MFYYLIYGLKIRSQIPISYLIETEATDHVDAVIQQGKVADGIHDMIDRNHGFGYRENSTWFMNDHAIFSVDCGESITVELLEGGVLGVCSQYITGGCMALLFEQRDYIALHSSSLQIGDKTISIAGFSGAGKSSLTTAFMEKGAKLLADDISMINEEKIGLVTYPAFPQQKLCEDLMTRNNYELRNIVLVDSDRVKYAISRKDKFCDATRRIDAIFILEPGDATDVTLTELQGMRKLCELLNCNYTRFMMKDFGLPIRRMQLFLKMAKQIPVYMLIRPIGIMSVDKQMELIERSLNQ